MEKGLSTAGPATVEVRRNPFGEGGMIRMENPFALKVGQVFTGFGIGCGVGIGHGRPINLGTPLLCFLCFIFAMNLGDLFKPKHGETHHNFLPQKPCALPMANQLLSATRGATDAFSGVTRQVNSALMKVGAKNIQVGVGCGIGFGHGFGVGIAVKPGVLQKIQACLLQAATTVAMKFGGVPNMSVVQGTLPISFPGATGVAGEPTIHSPTTQMGIQGIPGSRKDVTDSSFARTEHVLNSFLQNPILKQEDGPALKQVAGRLQAENTMLQMVLKHQQIIEDLVEENKKLRQILVEDLKVPATKIHDTYSTTTQSPCSDCFDCRRKLRKRR
ncbi:hypothetical protein LINGRAHAP2_LOCUS25253 [Linum grandiflorum]